MHKRTKFILAKTSLKTVFRIKYVNRSFGMFKYIGERGSGEKAKEKKTEDRNEKRSLF